MIFLLDCNFKSSLIASLAFYLRCRFWNWLFLAFIVRDVFAANIKLQNKRAH